MTNAPSPLSFNQEWHLVAEEVQALSSWRPTGARFPVVFRVDGDVDAMHIERALNAIVDRHAGLRTVYGPNARYRESDRRIQLNCFVRTGLFVPGLYVQRILSAACVSLQWRRIEDADALPELIRQELDMPLDTVGGPPIRATLAQSNDGGRFLIIILTHHTVDGWSIGVFVRELLALLTDDAAAQVRALPRVEAHYPDFTRWQLHEFHSGRLGSEERYWHRQWATLGDAAIRHRDSPFANRGAAPFMRPTTQERLALSADETAQTRELLTHLRLTPYQLFRTAMAVALHYLTGKRRLAFWANFANRRHPEFAPMLGWCSNTHIVAVDIDLSDRYADLCRRMFCAVREAQMHEALPLGALWQRLGRNLNTNDARVNFDVLAPRRPQQARPPLEFMPNAEGPRAMDLDIRLLDDNGILVLVAHFNADRYAGAGVARLLATIRAVVLQFAATPDATVLSAESLL